MAVAPGAGPRYAAAAKSLGLKGVTGGTNAGSVGEHGKNEAFGPGNFVPRNFVGKERINQGVVKGSPKLPQPIAPAKQQQRNATGQTRITVV